MWRIEYVADRAAKRSGAVRFLEVGGPDELGSSGASGFGIAAGEEDGEIWEACAQLEGSSGSPHARHDQIEDSKSGSCVFG